MASADPLVVGVEGQDDEDGAEDLRAWTISLSWAASVIERRPVVGARGEFAAGGLAAGDDGA